jgi:hypothetical protein
MNVDGLQILVMDEADAILDMGCEINRSNFFIICLSAVIVKRSYLMQLK